MKKFFKLCGTLLIVLLIVGMVFVGASYFLAGPGEVPKMVSEMTNGKIKLDLNGISVDLGGFLEEHTVYDINAQSSFDNAYDIWKDDVSKREIGDSAVTTLNMDLGGCTFVLEESEGDSYYMEYKGKGKSQAYQKANELYIKVLNTNEWGVGGKEQIVTLYIPQDAALENVSVNLGAGEMELDGLNVDSMDIDLGAGQIWAKGLKAEDIALSVGAGSIELKEVSVKDVMAEVGAGNCEISGEVTGNINVDCAMGNMTLKLAGKETDFNYEIQCVTGNVIIGSHEYSGVSQKQSIQNNAVKNVSLDCAMGNVEIKFEK